MILRIISIFDKGAGYYGTPVFAPSAYAALRSVKDLLSDPKSTLSLYPDDFHVYEVGSFDDSLGLITPHPHPVSLSSIREMLPTVSQPSVSECSV